MKKLITSLSFLSLTLSQTAFAAEAFVDVSESHENAFAIEYMRSEGMIQGYPDGTFKPNNQINRAEFIKIIVSAIATESEIENCDVSTIAYLSDVDTRSWYAPYVCVGKARGIVTGHIPSNGKPYLSSAYSINFIEAAKIITAGFGIGEPPLDCLANNGRACVEAAARGDTWYKRHVLALANHHAIPLSIDGIDHLLTRGEMAEIVYRIKRNGTKPSKTYEEMTGEVAPDEQKSLYENEEPKLSFYHPIYYTTITDEKFVDYPGTDKDWYRIEMQDYKRQNVYLTVEVNPDGYGPIFADIIYTLSEKKDGSLAINNFENFEGENYDDGKTTIVAGPFDASNGNAYYFRFTYPHSMEYESYFIDLIRSVKIAQ